jgi:hypothetical protein
MSDLPDNNLPIYARYKLRLAEAEKRMKENRKNMDKKYYLKVQQQQVKRQSGGCGGCRRNAPRGK